MLPHIFWDYIVPGDYWPGFVYLVLHFSFHGWAPGKWGLKIHVRIVVTYNNYTYKCTCVKGYSLNFNKIRTEGFVVHCKRNFPIDYYSVKSDKVYCNKPLNRHECTHTAEYRIIVKWSTVTLSNIEMVKCFAHYDTERWHIIPITYRGLLVDLCTMLDENSSCSNFTSLTSIQERCGSVLYNENTKYTQWLRQLNTLSRLIIKIKQV